MTEEMRISSIGNAVEVFVGQNRVGVLAFSEATDNVLFAIRRAYNVGIERASDAIQSAACGYACTLKVPVELVKDDRKHKPMRHRRAEQL